LRRGRRGLHPEEPAPLTRFLPCVRRRGAGRTGRPGCTTRRCPGSAGPCCIAAWSADPCAGRSPARRPADAGPQQHGDRGRPRSPSADSCAACGSSAIRPSRFTSFHDHAGYSSPPRAARNSGPRPDCREFSDGRLARGSKGRERLFGRPFRPHGSVLRGGGAGTTSGNACLRRQASAIPAGSISPGD
jgi:hypothetical protein